MTLSPFPRQELVALQQTISYLFFEFDWKPLICKFIKWYFFSRLMALCRMVQFPSRNAYNAALRAISRNGRLIRLERVQWVDIISCFYIPAEIKFVHHLICWCKADRTQWDLIAPFDGKAVRRNLGSVIFSFKLWMTLCMALCSSWNLTCPRCCKFQSLLHLLQLCLFLFLYVRSCCIYCWLIAIFCRFCYKEFLAMHYPMILSASLLVVNMMHLPCRYFWG